MRICDIKEDYFNHIIRYAKRHAEYRIDFSNMHHINIDPFMSEEEILSMRRDNIVLNIEET